MNTHAQEKERLARQAEKLRQKLHEPNGINNVAGELTDFYKSEFDEPIFYRDAFEMVTRSFWEEMGLSELRYPWRAGFVVLTGPKMLYLHGLMERVEQSAKEKLITEFERDQPILGMSEEEVVDEITKPYEKFFDKSTVSFYDLFDMRKIEINLRREFWWAKYPDIYYSHRKFVSKINGLVLAKIREMQEVKLLELTKEFATWIFEMSPRRLQVTHTEIEEFLLHKRVDLPEWARKLLYKFGKAEVAKKIKDDASARR